MSVTNRIGPRAFVLGRVVATPGALAAMDAAHDGPLSLLSRHMAFDWGDLDDEDKWANDLSTRNGTRILSAYKLKDGTRVWVITEADRSSTCILLPEEY